jgi:hypothetical protein
MHDACDPAHCRSAIDVRAGRSLPFFVPFAFFAAERP